MVFDATWHLLVLPALVVAGIVVLHLGDRANGQALWGLNRRGAKLAVVASGVGTLATAIVVLTMKDQLTIFIGVPFLLAWLIGLATLVYMPALTGIQMLFVCELLVLKRHERCVVWQHLVALSLCSVWVLLYVWANSGSPP